VDLAQYLRVLWRFRVVVVVGVILASLLALNSVARIQFDGGSPELIPRQHEVWRSAATVFVTQEGFPWGRTIFDETVEIESAPGDEPVRTSRFADPGRLSGLAVLYAELAKSDAVRRAFLARAPRGATYEPSVVKSTDGGSVLPLIYMTGVGTTPRMAQHAANLSTAAFRRYLGTKQGEARIPDDKRIDLVVTRRASPPELVEPRSMVRPIFLFLLVMMASIAVAFVLENVRPRGRPEGRPDVRPVAAPDPQPAAGAQQSRSA
jgi:hypothetical protein